IYSLRQHNGPEALWTISLPGDWTSGACVNSFLFQMGKASKRQVKRSQLKHARSGIRGRPKGTGTHAVYAELRRRIMRLDLAPGADVDEQALVREFKLSRTPVREALLRLAHEELVEIIPNRGTRVAALHFHEVGEIFDALEITIRLTSRW